MVIDSTIFTITKWQGHQAASALVGGWMKSLPKLLDRESKTQKKRDAEGKINLYPEWVTTTKTHEQIQCHERKLSWHNLSQIKLSNCIKFVFIKA